MTVETPLNQTVEKLRALSEEFSRDVFHSFFRSHPHERLVISPEFPVAAAVSFICHGADANGTLYPETENRLRELAEIITAHGFRSILPFADAITKSIRHYCMRDDFFGTIAAERAVEQAAEILNHQALSSISHPVMAEVVEVEKRCRNISVVRVLTDYQIDYRSGQFLTVNSDYTGGRWRDLCPSIPSNEARQVEFHVYAGDEATSILGASRAGDRLRIGAAGGGFTIDYEEDLLLLAHGTGLAAARAIIIDLLMRSNQPRTHLFVSADYPGELYELQGLWQLASAAPWLFIKPIVRNKTDAWWVGATEHSTAPRGLHLMEVGKLGEVVSSYGTWEGHQILITGPTDIVTETRLALLRGGTPDSIIQTQGSSRDYFWD
ncbi:2-polyprenylphenol hydroxylase-like oxidoreductase [Corynebacterium mustelae]|uniref:2-polyprenylphenol hydroxylase-like oxidoreductase n=1 Tax=Corynebacterium mustelae TaxID=571915 RepID=A0A0G3H0V1_9CORY|nr:oxidoreductase [Corynebacterium mustelae]AKK07041.1 2-polyprenylphenol hydroxylase-like oxidoreductase [Corynebacterium mustelae]